MQISNNKQNLSPSKAPAAVPAEAKEAKRSLGSKDAFVRSASVAPAAAVPAVVEKAAYTPPQVIQSPFNGNAPVLNVEAMDAAVISNSMTLRTLYALEPRFPFLLRAYSVISKVAGPTGMVAWFGLNIYNTVKFLRDPKSPVPLKAGIAGATALSGVAAASAVRMSLAAFNVMPASNAALQTLGRVCGVTSLGAATLLAGMDTYNTFRNPDSTSADKWLSSLGTVASGACVATLALGVTGPLGIILGVASGVFPLAKTFFGKKEGVVKFFDALSKPFSGLDRSSAKAFDVSAG